MGENRSCNRSLTPERLEGHTRSCSCCSYHGQFVATPRNRPQVSLFLQQDPIADSEQGAIGGAEGSLAGHERKCANGRSKPPEAAKAPAQRSALHVESVEVLRVIE